MTRPSIAVIGATGAVGGTALQFLSTRADIWGDVRLVGDDREVGQARMVRGQQVTIEPLRKELFAEVDVALFAVPDTVSTAWAPVAADQGCVVVDCSGAFRQDPEVPLVLPETNPAQVRKRPRGIITSPNATTTSVITAVSPLHQGWGLTELVVTSFQAVSGIGRAGVQRLYDEIGALAGNRRVGQVPGDVRRAVSDLPETSPFAGPIAYNVVPFAGRLMDGGWTSEEVRLRDESRKILGLPRLKVSATCVRVPVVTAHSLSVHATFANEISAEEARQALIEGPNYVVVLDDPGSGEFPNPADVVGSDPTFVGRIRQSPDFPTSLEMFICSDNLRKGAALNMVQVAELVAVDLGAVLPVDD
ncbi:aspartate-semialdehyde dehydrogenase [Luteipulveratus sp. YIM 133132]|uniref:Aspartate-semialdehyde dehydrogenase n=1 Tax=Luteipulveratus flavus TaxID=3031728 RepID=A0ABT6CBN2_9MICO|nr:MULTISPECIES: aspartate-semialdehyde dehydrogenase [unclassified Luteipulveratus]MDE9365666.1 aspartate-semialdehyde dehydrogenase [Luteipulveratus sp. YIM 133132]MDF8266296.1 aspartate-semialdehyde dehydrogenase [Luteipulveratus sp. YIM 133296]